MSKDGAGGDGGYGPNGTGGPRIGSVFDVASDPLPYQERITYVEPKKTAFSFNRFIVEPYLSDRQIKTATSTGATGFAMIQQKVAVKGLRLLVDVMLNNGQESFTIDGMSKSGPVIIKAGSTVYIREELLHTQEWAKKIMEVEGLGKFMLVDKMHIEFVQPV